ncbi:MAG: Flp pilus assembly complex ATPase component TadA [Candidatus Omnitrophica bacterium]|nr:Flp pilus assembly complex ATPase component TadA [Candidatus Omnitrophota bacterium]
MLLTDRIIEILTKQGSVKLSDLERVMDQHKKGEGKLSDLLVQEGLISESDLTMLLSNELKLPYLNLNLFSVEPKVIQLIPRKFAEKFEIIPLARIGKILTLAMSDPLNVMALDEVQRMTQCTIRPVISTQRDIHNALEKYYSDMEEIDDLIDAADEELQVIHEGMEKESVETAAASEEAPVVKMVDLFLLEAIRKRASDIHFEPYEQTFRVRYRIDGHLNQAYTPPKNMHGPLLARLKIMSGMDITEHRKPQDGRFKIKTQGKDIDFRFSVLPMVHGEKGVLRILDKSTLKLSMADLGFLPGPQESLEQAISKPYGMIIITGPTGSGKSTTLYTIMNRLNTPERNIMTIEDPVEYQVEGITQTQVAPEIGLTFSQGLRALLRQSPDIILIGEIRDNETADIAAKAALTGHLVFSTLHTNSAAGAVTRLLDMKVEPFLIASSVNLLAAQRLARRICQNCKEERPVAKEVLKRLQVNPDMLKNVRSYCGQGCERCGNSGFYGRLAVLETLDLDDELREMIISRTSSDLIQQTAVKKGMKLLFDNAFEQFRRGNTTLEEVFRIASI